ncbi:MULTISPECIES: hypothetical protein [Streptomyces]|uniref:hypothetical protein n=1 Tax=Streptomyces sp. SYP-A7185 TaxID=3040076 RepID=UPI0038F7FEE6
MESQSWKGSGIEYRRPDIPDLVIAAALFWLIHESPQAPEWVAFVIAMVALRCVRYRRVSESHHPVRPLQQ